MNARWMTPEQVEAHQARVNKTRSAAISAGLDPNHPPLRKKRTKHGNKITWVDGIRFDSEGEALRWQALQLLEKAEVIKDLMRQTRFELVVNGYLITTYIADFVYYENGHRIVEDFKGQKLPEFKLKEKLMLAVLGIKIRVTTSAT